jgi:hypothetical protein
MIEELRCITQVLAYRCLVSRPFDFCHLSAYQQFLEPSISCDLGPSNTWNICFMMDFFLF